MQLHLEQSDIKSKVYTKCVAYIYTWNMKKNWEVMSVLLVRYEEQLSPHTFKPAQTGIIDIAGAKVSSNNFKTSQTASLNYGNEL
jgi:hypothetical protein